MQQQQQQGQVAPSDDSQESPSKATRTDNEDTWGLGSATALDTLRRRNFRGRRSSNGDDGPNAD